MTTRTSISRFALVLGGLLIGPPATRALAAEPTTATEAQALAQQNREQADHFRALGGVGYKAGLVQRAEADAARYAALAATLAAPVATEAPAPEAARFAGLAAQYRAIGGAAYKAGLVQWAEAQARNYEAPPAAFEEAFACLPTKPAIVLACSQ
jgi:hypothetical protein